MSVKILKILLMIFVITLFSGCSNKELVYVDRPVEVYIPTTCKVPEVHCNFNKATDTDVINSMFMCIIDLKESIKVCQ